MSQLYQPLNVADADLLDYDLDYLEYDEELTEDGIFYPESDGQPMGESSEHIDLIILIKSELEDIYRQQMDVVVGGDLFWYPVKGNNKYRLAPDVMLVFGRPKRKRKVYMQWRENNIAPQVVFEMLSQSNYRPEMARKFEFYQTNGVEEYYVFDTIKRTLEGWVRQAQTGKLEPIPQMRGWVSPRMGVRFDLINEELGLYRPDSERFITLAEAREQARREREQAYRERLRTTEAREQAQREREQTRLERLRTTEAREQARREQIRATRAEELAQLIKEQAEAERAVQLRRVAELEVRLRQMQAKIDQAGQS